MKEEENEEKGKVSWKFDKQQKKVFHFLVKTML